MALEILFFAAHAVLCVLLVVLVLIQRPSGGGALGIGGGSSSQSPSGPLPSITAGVGFLVFVTSLSIAFLEKNKHSKIDELLSSDSMLESEEKPKEEIEVPIS